MKVLGIDPGIGRVGFAFLEKQGSALRFIECGTFETKSTDAFAHRLAAIYEKMQQLIKTHKPDVVAVEDLFFANNAKTAFAVGQARGVILLTAALGNIATTSYTPLQVKLAVTGYGKADKKQVAQMVKAILKLQSLPKLDDATDALAIAITHSFSSKILQK